jgi:hypothetical protein
MAFRHGKKAEVTVNSVDLTVFSDKADLNLDVDMADTSTFGSDWKTGKPGQAGGKLELSGKYDPTATTGPNDTLSALVGADAVPVIYEPGGSEIGQSRRTFDAFVTSFGESSPVGGVVLWKATLTIDGEVTFATIAA